jgi:hypothetical protein
MNPSINSQPAGDQNSFFGVKVSKQGTNVINAPDNQLLYKNDYTKETFFGTSGNISFGAFTSAVTGQTGQGLQVTNSSGQVIFELNGQTWYWFDTSGNVVMEVGYLPVAQIYGWAVATPGNTLKGVV